MLGDLKIRQEKEKKGQHSSRKIFCWSPWVHLWKVCITAMTSAGAVHGDEWRGGLFHPVDQQDRSAPQESPDKTAGEQTGWHLTDFR